VTSAAVTGYSMSSTGPWWGGNDKSLSTDADSKRNVSLTELRKLTILSTKYCPNVKQRFWFMPIWMFGVLYHCGINNFLDFLRKIVEIVKKNLIKPIKGNRIHGNTSYEPLKTFLQPMMRSVQVSKNVKK